MQILGSYKSSLPSWYYNELLDLVSAAISQGDYAGGATFDQAALAALIASDSAFANITLPTAGTRTIDEDFNYPLNLLNAQLQATATEIENFTAEIATLIDILTKDTELLDQLLYAAELNIWLGSLPIVIGSTPFSWSFGIGFGKVGFNLPYSDPANSVVYDSSATLGKFFNAESGVESYGLTPGAALNTYKPVNISWDYKDIGFYEENVGTDWAELDFLQKDILLDFSAPQVDIILPTDAVTAPFEVSGTSTTQGIPIYVQTLFTPRRTTISVSSGQQEEPSDNLYPIFPGDQVNVSSVIVAQPDTNGSCSLYLQYFDSANDPVLDIHSNPIVTLIGSLTTGGIITNLVTTSNQSNIVSCQLLLVSTGVTTGGFTLPANSIVNTPIRLTNGYTIDPTSVAVFSSTAYYTVDLDFVITGQGYLTLITIPPETNITISFSEYYPSYKCSVNQINWSSIIMFDYTRPYPDTETMFLPIPIGVDPNGVKNKLPIVDESGVSTGLYIALTGLVTGQYLLMVYQNADSINPGQHATLTIDFGKPSYMNSLNLSSYTNFPAVVNSIQSQAFTNDTTQTLFTGNYLLEDPTTITFPTTLVSIVTITLTQPNYTIKQHQILPDDYLRRQAINDLQAIIPTSGQQTNILPAIVFTNGYQYEFGVEGINGVNSVVSIPTVFISGPYTVNGPSSTVTFDVNYAGDVDFYLCYQSYNGNDALVDSNTLGIALTPGMSTPFPYTSGTTTSAIAYTNLYIKTVFRNAAGCVSTFLLQVD
jgi:hypothetical protein